MIKICRLSLYLDCVQISKVNTFMSLERFK